MRERDALLEECSALERRLEQLHATKRQVETSPGRRWPVWIAGGLALVLASLGMMHVTRRINDDWQGTIVQSARDDLRAGYGCTVTLKGYDDRCRLVVRHGRRAILDARGTCQVDSSSYDDSTTSATRFECDGPIACELDVLNGVGWVSIGNDLRVRLLTVKP